MDHIIINIICGDIIGSAVIQGGRDSTIDYSMPEISPAIVAALRAALGDIGNSLGPNGGDYVEK